MRTLLCAISKNDENYLLEWVNHYLNIGVTKIVIYNNSAVDNYSDILRYYINKGYVVVDNSVLGKPFIDKNVIDYYSAQSYVYTKCYALNIEMFDYFCFFDTDEYLMFSEYNDIGDFLKQKKFYDYDSIRICWKLYNDSDIVIPLDYSIKKFKNPINTHYNRICKSIIKSSKNLFNKRITAHGMYNIRSCDCNGDSCWCKENHDNIYIGDNPILTSAWLNHYRFKTIYEYIAKKMPKMTCTLEKYSIDEFFKFNKKTREKLDYIRTLGINYE